MKKCNLSKLLEETPLTYYWIGFLLADGHISNQTRLSVTLSLKDLEHLKKLQKFLQIENIRVEKQASISAMDSKIIRKFCKKFKINSNKTKYPPDLSFIKNKDLIEALKIGFIDGDGCIDNQTGRKDCKLRIKCYKSWLNNLLSLFGNCYINNQGYAQTTITNSIILKELKNKALALNLPILSRKWDKIDINFTSRQEIGQLRILEVSKLLTQRKKNKEIAQYLNIGASAVSQIIKRNNLSYE